MMNPNDIINLILGLIGVVGTAFGIWSYFKMKEEKDPQCHYRTFQNMVKRSTEDKLKITYNTNEVNRVSTTYVFIWNRGKKPILKSEICTPILISFPDVPEFILLDHNIIRKSRKEINFDIVPRGKNTFEITFEFLENNDGAIIEFKHNGDTKIEPTITGTIIGVRQGLKANRIHTTELTRVSFTRVIIFTLFIILVNSAILGLFLLSLQIPFNTRIQFRMNFALFISILITIAMLFYFVRRYGLQSLFQSQLPYPKSFDIDVDDDQSKE